MKSYSNYALSVILLPLLILTTIAAPREASAAQLQLDWMDNSVDEDGFKVERSKGKSGAFTQIALTGANVTSYVDSNLAAATTYCYRVRAYNAVGDSSYSNPACATTSATTLTLSVTKAGSGTVSSSPAGIRCGTACTATYPSGAVVRLVAAPAPGSIFAGWSGGCSGTGRCTVTVTGNIAVTATFAPPAPTEPPEPPESPPGFALTVNKTGRGTVSSDPPGIDCGQTCSGSYPSDASVTLTPIPDPGSSFLGWSDGICSGLGSCMVALSADTSVTANFSTPIGASIGVFRPSTGEWLLDLDGNGVFDGCNVDGCIGPLGQQGDFPVTGAWTNAQTTALGVFDSSTATWYLDLNGNGVLDGCELDSCRYVFGQPGDRPVVGDWTGSGVDRIGVFRPSTGQWVLDLNGDRQMSRGCAKDRCITSFGQPGDLPVVGDWDGSGTDKIGVFRPATGEWFLDLNGNGQLDGCDVDACLGPFGEPGDLPVVGKW